MLLTCGLLWMCLRSHYDIQMLRNNIWHPFGQSTAKQVFYHLDNLDTCVSCQLQSTLIPTVDKGSLDLQRKFTFLVSWKPQMAIL